MTASEMKLNWDRDHDTLSVIKAGADPSRTINMTLNADMVMRIDESQNIVGFIIDDFSRIFPDLVSAPEYLILEKFDHAIQHLSDLFKDKVAARLAPQVAAAVPA